MAHVDYYSGLYPASFRGIPFAVAEESSQIGRRIQAHEYPGRDEPYHEDLGLGIQGFAMEAIVTGADFAQRAAALEAALKQKGPGTLVHPSAGEITVVARSATRRTRSDAAGEVVFAISFERYGQPLYPAALRNTGGALIEAASQLMDASAAEFVARYSTQAAPDFIAADAAQRLETIISGLAHALKNRGLYRIVPAALWPASWPVAKPQGIAEQARALFTGIAALAEPAARSAVGSMPAAPSLSPARTVALIRALGDASGQSVAIAVPSPGSNQARRVRNAQAIDGFFRAGALGAAVRSARHAQYESREEAISVRAAMADDIARLRDDLGTHGWDASWRAAGDLLAALSRDINERIGRLPRTMTVRTSGVRSSLSLAQRLYGQEPGRLFARARDIVVRNRVRHPLFVPSERVEVLIDA